MTDGARNQQTVQRQQPNAEHEQATCRQQPDAACHRAAEPAPIAWVASARLISSPYFTRYVGTPTDARLLTTNKLLDAAPNVLGSITIATACTCRVTMPIRAWTHSSSTDDVMAITVLSRG